MTAKRRKTTSRRERRAPLPPAPADAKSRWDPVLLPLLALLTVATLWPVLGSEFVVLDDDAYVYSNPVVRNGLTWSGVKWAFSTGHEANWHPNVERLTVISGTIGVGVGDAFDETKGHEMTAGTYATMQPKVHHFAWTKGETEIQLTTIGPWKLVYVNPKDDPSKMAKK